MTTTQYDIPEMGPMKVTALPYPQTTTTTTTEPTTSHLNQHQHELTSMRERFGNGVLVLVTT